MVGGSAIDQERLTHFHAGERVNFAIGARKEFCIERCRLPEHSCRLGVDEELCLRQSRMRIDFAVQLVGASLSQNSFYSDVLLFQRQGSFDWLLFPCGFCCRIQLMASCDLVQPFGKGDASLQRAKSVATTYDWCRAGEHRQSERYGSRLSFASRSRATFLLRRSCSPIGSGL